MCSDIGYWLSDQVQSGYRELSISIVHVSRSLVFNRCESAYFQKLETDENYEHIAVFLYAAFIWKPHCVSVFLSKQCVLFPLYMKWVYGTAAAVHQNDIVLEDRDVWEKVLQHKDGPLALSFYAQLRTVLP